MRTFRVALAQTNLSVGDFPGNTKKIIDRIRRAQDMHADMVAFPELAIPGYPPEDLILKPQFIESNRTSLESIIEASQDIAVVVRYVDAAGGDTHNSAAIIANGQLIATYHKIFLPTYGVFDEDRYFRAGNTSPVIMVNGTSVGVNICEDAWYAVGPTAIQRSAGAEVIVNINGSPFHVGKRILREKMLSTRAIDNSVFFCYVNLVGGQDELVFDGGSLVVDPHGEIIASAKQFEEALLVVDLEINRFDSLPSCFTSGRARTRSLSFWFDSNPYNASADTTVLDGNVSFCSATRPRHSRRTIDLFVDVFDRDFTRANYSGCHATT